MRIDGPQITGSFNLNGDTIADLDIFATTSSLNNLTSSVATTGSNLFKGTQTISGSIIPAVDNTYDLGSLTHQFRDLYLSSASLYIDGTKVLSSTTQELQITTDAGQSFKILEAGSDTITLQSGDGNITLASSGGGDVILDPTNGIISLKGTITVQTGNKIVASDGNNIHFGDGIVISGSLLSTGTALVSGSSQITFSGLTGVPSGIVSGSSQIVFSGLTGVPSGLVSGSSQLLNSSGIVSSSTQVAGFGFANTGSNNFVGTQTITGSLFISSDLVVQGSSSLQNITASAVNIGANIVNLNTATPAIRFAGLNIFDSGSIGGSGSFLYDSVQDEFIFVHRGDGTNITSSVVLMGPETYNNVGNEIYVTNNRILKGTGNDHVADSIISEINGGIGISGSLSITGSIIATGTSLISGSSQVDVMSTTNIARLATTGSNVFTGALTGTTATFSGKVQFSTTTDYTTVTQGQFFSKGGGDIYVANILAGASNLRAFTIQRNDSKQFSIGLNPSDNLAFLNSSDSVIAHISSTGIATFSGGVTAGGSIYTGGVMSTSMTNIFGSTNNIYYAQSSASAIQVANTNSVTNGSIVITNTGGTGAYSIIGNAGLSSGYGLFIQSQDRTTVSYYPLLLQPNGGNVGVGTSTPIDRLNVSGGITLTSTLSDPTNTQVGSLQIGYNGTNGVIKTWSSSPLIISTFNYQSFETDGTDRLRILSNGNIGVSITNPAYRFSVQGASNSGMFIKQGSQIGDTPSSTTFYSALTFENTSTTNAWSIGYSQGAKFSINYFDAGSTYSRLFTVTPSGDVGVGTVFPARKLHIMGQVAVDMVTTGIVFQEGDGTAQIVSYKQTEATYSDLHLRGANLGIVIKGISGDVGIGTPTPNTKLEVVGGNNLPPSTGTQNYTIALRDPTSMVAGVGGSIILQGFKTSTSAIGNFAYIAGKKENGTAGNESGFLSLGTFDSGGIPSEKFRIDSAGRVTKPFQPSWCLRPNSGGNDIAGNSIVGWSDSTSGSSSKAVFLNGVTLSGSGSGILGATSTGRLSVPVTGKYKIWVTIRGENNPATGNIYIDVNGNQIARQHVEIWGTTNGYPYAHGFLSLTLNLAANDYIEIRVVCPDLIVSGFNDTVNWFSGHLIG